MPKNPSLGGKVRPRIGYAENRAGIRVSLADWSATGKANSLMGRPVARFGRQFDWPAPKLAPSKPRQINVRRREAEDPIHPGCQIAPVAPEEDIGAPFQVSISGAAQCAHRLSFFGEVAHGADIPFSPMPSVAQPRELKSGDADGRGWTLASQNQRHLRAETHQSLIPIVKCCPLCQGAPETLGQGYGDGTLAIKSSRS